MKIIGIVCSPRVGGNTEILMQEAMSGAEEVGAETELIFIRDKNIRPCDGCCSCEVSGKCHIDDDMQEIYEKLLDSDGIIISAPTYITII